MNKKLLLISFVCWAGVLYSAAYPEIIPQITGQSRTNACQSPSRVTIHQCNSFELVQLEAQKYAHQGYRVVICVDIDETIVSKPPRFAAINPEDLKILRSLQLMDNIMVFGLTARRYDKRQITEITLKNVDIDYSSVCSKLRICEGSYGHFMGYSNGIIYSQRQTADGLEGKKDESLNKFLEQNLQTISPEGKEKLIILFIDDSKKYITQVEEELHRQNIQGVLFHFTDWSSDLFKAVDENNVEKVAQLLENPVIKIDIKTCDDNLVLHRAIQNGFVEVVKILVVSGANLEIRNELGYTALIRAVLSNQKEAVEILIECGADVNVVDNYANTPLMGAALKNNFEIMNILLNSGAIDDINQRNKSGWTALAWSEYGVTHQTNHGSPEVNILVKERLLQAGAIE